MAERILKVALPAESKLASDKYASACNTVIRDVLNLDSKSSKFLESGEKVWARIPLTNRKVLEHLTSSPCAYEFRVGAGYVDFRWRYEVYDNSPDRNVVHIWRDPGSVGMRCRYCAYTLRAPGVGEDDALLGATMKSHLVEHRMERLERSLSKIKKRLKEQG